MNGNMRQGPTKRYGKTAICHRRQISIKMIMLKYRTSQCGNLSLFLPLFKTYFGSGVMLGSIGSY